MLEVKNFLGFFVLIVSGYVRCVLEALVRPIGYLEPSPKEGAHQLGVHLRKVYEFILSSRGNCVNALL